MKQGLSERDRYWGERALKKIQMWQDKMDTEGYLGLAIQVGFVSKHHPKDVKKSARQTFRQIMLRLKHNDDRFFYEMCPVKEKGKGRFVVPYWADPELVQNEIETRRVNIAKGTDDSVLRSADLLEIHAAKNPQKFNKAEAHRVATLVRQRFNKAP